MIDRRRFLGITAGAGATLALGPELLRAVQRTAGTPDVPGALHQPARQLIRRAIPSSGEMLPVIGLGFSNHAGCADPGALREVLRTFVDNGGTFFDSNFANEPASQDAIVAIVNEFGNRDRLFLSWRGYAPAPGRPDHAAVRAHIETSLARLRVPRLDMVDLPRTPVFDAGHWAVLQEAKKEGRIRYISAGIGAVSTASELESLRSESIDFISLPYAIDNRGAEETILPFARDHKIGVMVHFPLGGAGGQSCVSDKGLFARVANTPLPPWAAEFDATTWAQFFLKYVISHPAVTVVRVGTTKPHHMLDNIGGGSGRLPDEAMRKRMAEFIDEIPLAVPPQFLERYVGAYTAASGLTAIVRRDGDQLFVKLGTNPEVRLVARTVRRFADPQRSIFEFQLTGVGPATRTAAVILEQGGQKITLEKK